MLNKNKEQLFFSKQNSFIFISIIYIFIFYYLNISHNLKDQCDEHFHLRQTIYYRNNLYLYYTKHLTTFPGTFLVTQLYMRLLNKGYIGIKNKQLRKRYIDNELTQEEFKNYLFDARIMAVFFSILSLFILSKIKTKSYYFLFTIAFLPIKFLYSFLIYTENTSLLFLIIYYYFTHYKTTNQLNLFFICFLMILMRQTNIIWTNYLPLIEVFQLIYHINLDIKNQFIKAMNILKKYIYVLILDIVMIIFYFLNEKSFVISSKKFHPLKLHIAQIIHFSFHFLFHFPCFHFKLFEMLKKVKNIKKMIKWILTSLLLYIIYQVSLNWNCKPCNNLLPERHYNDIYFGTIFCNKKYRNILIIYLSLIFGAFISDDFNLFNNAKIVSWLFCSALSCMFEGYVEVRYFLPCFIFLILIINDFNNEGKGENFGYYLYNNYINCIFSICEDYFLIKNLVTSPYYRVY